jgi:putative transposase
MKNLKLTNEKTVRYFKMNLKNLSNEDSKALHVMFKHAPKLYNEALYLINRHYERTGKYLVYGRVAEILKDSEHFKLLGSKMAVSVIRNLDINYKNYLTNSRKSGNLKPPGYRKNNFFIAIFNSFIVRNGVNLRLSLTRAMKEKYGFDYHYFLNFVVPKQFENVTFTQIRITQDRGDYYLVLHYDRKVKVYKPVVGRYLGVDFGMNNLMTCYINTGAEADFCEEVSKPFIISGKPVKLINYKMLKKIGDTEDSSIRNKLWKKRANKIDAYFNIAVKKLFEKAVENRVEVIVVGYFKDIKSNYVNRNFYYIPYLRLRTKIRDKAKSLGVKVVFINESYTSKCSYYDREDICEHEYYLGRRVNRGLFRTSEGKLVNADVNGAANIARKYNKDLFDDYRLFFKIPERIL